MEEKDIIKLADIEYKNGNFATALEYYKEYIEKNPPNAAIHNITGYLYRKIDLYETIQNQLKHFEKAYELDPEYEAVIRNLALTNSMAGSYEKSLYFFEKLLKFNPTIDDYFAYACLKITLGDFDNGWKHYECRLSKNYARVDYPNIEKPRWEGQELKDKTLLVQYEQGFGDTLQFFRYVKHIKPLVGKIIFRVQPQMVDLLKTSDSEIEIVSEKTPIENLDFDYHTPLMSFPYVLKTQMNSIPLPEGYIKADATKVQKYKEEFFDNNDFKIGICWEGSQIGNRDRNIPLKQFYRLTKLKNVKVYSFQKNPTPGLFKNLPEGFEFIDLSNTFNDFSDTAAAMANLDLFVTGDNSVFNLAGAMGKKTFVLLNQNAEWRWFLDNDTTPWYDSVKIFKKQKETESWSLQMVRVLEEVKSEVKKLGLLEE